ncbi:MAG: transposase, partial [Armatimonadetes bacterium]|nr:transposase [Armatimonadota bacterium]
MIRAENLMTPKLQEKYSRFHRSTFRSFSKPEQKFLKDCSFRVLSSQSCIVRRIGQSLRESISSKKTQERLIYHLDNSGLNDKVSQTLLQRQCRKLKQDSLILVDPSDIVKKYAMRMEGLSRVRDGNDGKWKPGYDALDIVGVNRENEDISIFPIHSQLHSNTIEIDTMKNKLFDRIVDIIVHSNNKGTFIFDRGFDDKKVIKELHHHDASYIIRMKKNRDVYLQGRKHNIASVANETKLRYRFHPQKGVTISAGISSISIPLNPHPVKKPILAEARLVVAKIRSKGKNGTYRSGMFYLLSYLSDNALSNRETVKFVLDSYRLRWKIEEVHRQVKTNFCWEEIQLQTYRRLQAMNTLLWVAISFLYDLDKWKYQITALRMSFRFMLETHISIGWKVW